MRSFHVSIFFFSPHQVNTFTLDSSGLALPAANPVIQAIAIRPGKILSRRIDLPNPRVLHFIAGSLKACLMGCPKKRIALVDHRHTFLVRPRACGGFFFVNVVFLYIVCVTVQACHRREAGTVTGAGEELKTQYKCFNLSLQRASRLHRGRSGN